MPRWSPVAHPAASPGTTTRTISRSTTRRSCPESSPTKPPFFRSISVSTRDLLRANDARFHDQASGFSADEWSQPSLCDGWTNHDVLAHLVVGCSAGATAVTAEILRHGGSFDRANAALACSLAATRSPVELLDDFARLTERPRGLGRYFPRRLLLDR